MALAMRVLGPSSTHFVFKQNNSPVDRFTLYEHDGKVVIEGNNDISMCVGLNYYLRHYAKVHISWSVSDPVQLPNTFPTISDTVSATARTPLRYYFAPSDFATTMRWWWWPQWERMIDWMALNGINRPLRPSADYIQASEDKRRKRLQSWILEREEELGMVVMDTPSTQALTPQKNDDLRSLSAIMDSTLRHQTNKAAGINAAHACSNIAKEFMLEKAWQTHLTDEQWITDWCNARLGSSDPNAHQMWLLLLDSVMPRQPLCPTYTQIAQTPPNSQWRKTMSASCASHLNTAWLGLAMCTKSKRDSYYYDLTTLASLWLAQCFDEAVLKFNIAARHKDTASMREQQQVAILILTDIDRLLSTHAGHLAASQIDMARSWGNNRDDRAYYEQLATEILIAEPQYQLTAGMVKERLIPRWNIYFENMTEAVHKGRAVNDTGLKRQLDDFDSLSKSSHKSFNAMPSGDPRNVLTSIISKSFPAYFRNAEQLSAYMEQFPRSQLIDVYKYCFQDHFGPMHLSQSGTRPDSSACAGAMLREIEQLAPNDSNPAYQYTAPSRQYVRVNLRLVRDGVLPLETLTSALLQSMTATGDIELWRSQWEQLLVDMPHVIIRPGNYAADSAAIASMLLEGKYAAHHSQHFNRAYNYHYRIIRADIFEKRLLPMIKKK